MWPAGAARGRRGGGAAAASAARARTLDTHSTSKIFEGILIGDCRSTLHEHREIDFSSRFKYIR